MFRDALLDEGQIGLGPFDRLLQPILEIDLGGELDLRAVVVDHPRLGRWTSGPVRLLPNTNAQLRFD